MSNPILDTLCERTGTKPYDWIEVDGYIQIVGHERWYLHTTQMEAYTCNDAGNFIIEVNPPECPHRDDPDYHKRKHPAFEEAYA